MKNLLLLFVSVLLCSAFSAAQDLEKVKGDRELTIKQTYVDEFSKIVVGEDFEVELFYNSKPSVEVEIDSNLHEFISMDVVDGVLTLKTTREIKARQMNVKINYGNTFTDIEVFGDAEIRSLTTLEIKTANIKATGSSRAYLNIRGESFKFVGLEKVKARLNVTATNATLEMSDNAKADALINATEIKADLYQRANADVEGTASKLLVRADNNAQFNGRNLTANTCSVTAEIASDVYVEVTENVTIEATGSSEVYLFGNAKIQINKFTDTAKLQKKEK